MSHLDDEKLMPIARQASPGAIEEIAIEYFGIKFDEIRIFQERWRENVVMKSFECLKCWRDKNPGIKVHSQA